tara:strand:+ start:30 stop:215 length:186 start_codon:yes stop_codon:yes gene_type:complete
MNNTFTTKEEALAYWSYRKTTTAVCETDSIFKVVDVDNLPDSFTWLKTASQEIVDKVDTDG